MDYAVPTNKPFILSKKPPIKSTKSQESQSIRQFFKTHDISVTNDPVTGEVVIKTVRKTCQQK